MTSVCPGCGHENPDDARFCSQCGHALADSFSGVEGERRQITVFFSDVSGYTAMSEVLDPEDVRGVMNQVFGRAGEIVEKYGGRIDSFIGDAVMAVFGDPMVHEDDAERAVRAALELHAAVEELNPEVEAKIGQPIAMHTGINTGLVVTSGAEFDSAVGDAINVASRLEDLSEPGEILIGPEIAQAVSGVFAFEERGKHLLKGKSEPVPVTRVLGFAPTRVEPSRRQADFVGRHEELGVLLGAVERMRDGESNVITIRAEAGTGKTRLLAEFRGRLPDDVQWLEGRAYAYQENIPYAAVIDLLRRAMGIGEDDSPETVETKLRTAVTDLVDDVDRVYTPLTRLFGVETPKGAGLDRETYRKRLLDSVVEMAESLSRRAPTVLTFQDLHWADPSTVDLIRGLIDQLETPSVIVAKPFERVVLQQLIPIPGRRPTHTIIDLRFSITDAGTRFSQTATKPTGPLLQRSLARLMMTARRSRTQADMDEFRKQIIEDYTADHQHREIGEAIPSSLIESAASDSLENSQADVDG